MSGKKRKRPKGSKRISDCLRDTRIGMVDVEIRPIPGTRDFEVLPSKKSEESQ